MQLFYLLGFFVSRMVCTTFAELTQFKSLFDGFLVLVRTISQRFTLRTLQFNHVVLRHSAMMLSEIEQRVNGAACRTRTDDLHFTKVLLYQLS